MKTNKDLHIISLYYTEYGYGYPEDVYDYNFKNNKGQMTYTFGCNGISPIVNVKDNEKFSKQIFEIIVSNKKELKKNKNKTPKHR